MQIMGKSFKFLGRLLEFIQVPKIED